MVPELSTLKVALVHDWLNGMRGGEKCFEVFCEIFPNADIYTLIYEPEQLSPTITSMPVKTSLLQKFDFARQNYRYFLPIFPWMIEQFNLNHYDIILSSSHCVAKGVRYNHHPYHISYIHAPMRYIWQAFDTYFGKNTTSFMVSTAAQLIRPYLQDWDRRTAQNIHTLLCNSRNIQQQIRTVYQREAQVIYPPVDLTRFSYQAAPKEYYLMVGALAPNKRADLAIESFNHLKYPLKIVGTGQESDYCRSIAGPTIEFVGSVPDERLPSLYHHAKAFIFPGEDDFGITPLEAQACGTPVIAYAKGGALETVTEQTGIFFDQQRVNDLCEAIKTIENGPMQFEPEACIRQASRFSRERFKQHIMDAVRIGYQQWMGDSKNYAAVSPVLRKI